MSWALWFMIRFLSMFQRSWIKIWKHSCLTKIDMPGLNLTKTLMNYSRNAFPKMENKPIWWGISSARYKWIDGMKELLITLRKQGIPSVYFPTTRHGTTSSIEEYSFRVVDHHFVSYKLRARKPSDRAYKILCKRFNEPQNAIFIDDRKELWRSPRSGIRAIHFQMQHNS